MTPQDPTRRAMRRRGRPSCSPVAIAAGIACAFFAVRPSEAVEIVDPGQGPVDVRSGSIDVTELSGIAYAGADRYYAVSDEGARLFPMTIDVDRATGFILEAVPEEAVVLVGGYDLEGIAMLDEATVIVCDEAMATLREHRISDGSLLRQHRLPGIFRTARSNLGVESLTRTKDAIWVANEEALARDGPTASSGRGTRVRLQRLDSSGAPAGQWAYETDSHPGPALFGRAYSGVSDLLALPDGELLVLERSLSSPGFRARIYQVEFASATRTEEIASLEDRSVAPVEKRLLWESRSFTANFEGITLGPVLAAGDSSLILVADDGGAGPPVLYALRLRIDPAPVTSAPPGETRDRNRDQPTRR